MRMIRLLVGNPPQSISALMESTAVTRTAVTEQLNELARAGFVERQSQPASGRGRPQYMYKATDAASLILYAEPVYGRAVDLAGAGRPRRR